VIRQFWRPAMRSSSKHQPAVDTVWQKSDSIGGASFVCPSRQGPKALSCQSCIPGH
jgi:hypothetical protein